MDISSTHQPNGKVANGLAGQQMDAAGVRELAVPPSLEEARGKTASSY